MKTQIKKTTDSIIINVEGRMDFESQDGLRESLLRIADQTKTDSVPKKVIFNFENLQFVGSSGISAFVQTLKDFNATATGKARYCNVGAEFQRIIKAFDEQNAFEFFDTEERARRSFDN